MLIGRSMLYCWLSAGWCVGVIKEANVCTASWSATDGGSHWAEPRVKMDYGSAHRNFSKCQDGPNFQGAETIIFLTGIQQ